MKRKYIIIAGLVWMSFLTLANSQVTLSGQLIDEMTGHGLEFANVVLYDARDSALVSGTISDEKGHFQLDKVKKGQYFLEAKFLGYETARQADIIINQQREWILEPISLRPAAELLNEVQIQGTTMTAINKVDRQVYEASKFQAAQGGTATDLLKNLPAVVVNPSGEISVRGSTGFVVLINGKPIQMAPEVLLNQIAANGVKNIEIITSPSAKYDPEGKAGIINIITDRSAVDGAFTQVNLKYGLPSIEDYDTAVPAKRFGGDIVFNYLKGKWDLSASASYLRNDISGRRVGDVYTIIDGVKTQFPSDGERSFDEVNYSGRLSLGYEPSTSQRFQLGFFAGKRSKDRLADILYYNNEKTNLSTGNAISEFTYYNENLRIRKGDFVLGSLDYDLTLPNASKLNFSALYEYTLLGGPTTNLNLGWPNTDFVIQDEYNTNDNPLNGLRLSIDYQLAPSALGQWSWGYQFRNLDHTGDFVYERKNNETGIFELVPDFSSEVDLKRSIHSAYGQLDGEKGPWSYNVGLRIEAMDRDLALRDKTGIVDTLYEYNFVKPFPSASVMYTFNENLRWKAAYTKRVERTTTFKMNPFPEREHSETLEQGDPHLLPEFIDQLETGLIINYDTHSTFANIYFRHTNNLINRVNTIYNDTILNRIYSNVGKAKAIGLEVGNDWNFSDQWNVFAGGNLYHNTIDGRFDERPVKTQSWIYSFNLNLTYQFGTSWQAQGNFNYLSQRNTAQGEDSEFYSPNLSLRKSFLEGRLNFTLQWQNIDLGLFKTNEQRITTYRPNEFYTTTNYVYEVDMIALNVSYTFNHRKNESKFINSEFGAKEF